MSAAKKRSKRRAAPKVLERSAAFDLKQQYGSFIVWMTPDRALLCDTEAPLEQECAVVWVENGWACGEAKVVSKQPGHRSMGVAVKFDGNSNVLHIDKRDLVRVIGVYEAQHEKGKLPKGNRLSNAVRVLRPRIVGDGTPFPSHGVRAGVDFRIEHLDYPRGDARILAMDLGADRPRTADWQ